MFQLGFQFRPKERELIFLLRKKVLGEPVEFFGVVAKQLYEANPWIVFTDDDPWEHNGDIIDYKLNPSKKMKSFIHIFTRLNSSSKHSNRKQRKAGSGTWTGLSRPEAILNGRKELIGVKKSFTFEVRKGQNNTQFFGHWIMYEFSLAGVSLKGVINRNGAISTVVCKIIRSNWEPKSLILAFKRPRWLDAENPVRKKQRQSTRTVDYDDDGDGDLNDELDRWLDDPSDLDSTIVPAAAQPLIPLEDGQCNSHLTHQLVSTNAQAPDASELLPLSSQVEEGNSPSEQESNFSSFNRDEDNGDVEFDDCNPVSPAAVFSIEECTFFSKLLTQSCSTAPIMADKDEFSSFFPTPRFEVSPRGLEEVVYHTQISLSQEGKSISEQNSNSVPISSALPHAIEEPIVFSELPPQSCSAPIMAASTAAADNAQFSSFLSTPSFQVSATCDVGYPDIEESLDDSVETCSLWNFIDPFLTFDKF